MNSLTDLREVADVVIGVDTHVHTHSAAVIDSATGGVLGEITVAATAAGYAELVEFANNHPMLRAWAIEGTGGHGAGLTRYLLASSEIVIELDRPKRAARRNGAKSDPLDAIRAAREAMARPRLGTPRTGGERQALSVLLAARRSAINASTEAQLQMFSLVVAAPEPIRVRFRRRAGVGHRGTTRSLPRCSTPPRICGCTAPGTSRRPAQWSPCGPWLVARTRCSKRHGSCRRR
jgi:transposase